MLHINDSKTANVVSKYGTETAVNWAGKVTLIDYDNERGYIEWNVPKADDSFFYTDVLVAGKVDSVKERLRTWNNTPRIMVALVCQNLDAKDRGTVEESVAKYVTDNQQLFFTKCGNWRRNNLRQQATAALEVCKKTVKQLGVGVGGGRAGEDCDEEDVG